jgi:DNA-binding NarL/FixJ family response regulator
MTTTCLLAWAAVLLTLPIVFLLWATESREQRIRRWHCQGMSQRAIAERLGVSRYRVRQALT